MSSITIGKTEDGKDLEVDLARLAETRLLIQAGSGGGKSYLIRVILERSHGKIQQIVLDVEGDFASLREKYDYVLAAASGADVVANVKTAELLARKTLELEASIIIDLYELKHHDRIRFVKLFLDAMTNAPKELWHPCLVVVDEAHIFAPEKGESEAMSAVIDLVTRGRKRGFCAVLATQRLSKMHKDAAAECLNKLIGMTGLDIDRKRASEELGFTDKQATLSLRDLDPGQFYAFGPAISKVIQKVSISKALTTHPKAGQRTAKTMPVRTDKITAILAKLTDLPKEAEQEVKDKASLVAENAKLKREITLVRQCALKPEATKLEVEQARQAGYQKGFADGAAEVERELQKAQRLIADSQKKLVDISKIIGTEAAQIPTYVRPVFTAPVRSQVSPTPKASTMMDGPSQRSIQYDGEKTFGRAERLILKFLAVREGKSFNRSQIGAMTGYSPRGGGFNNSLSKLKMAGLVKQLGGDSFIINSENLSTAIEILGSDYNQPEQNALEQWLEKLGKAPKLIYKVLLDNPGQSYTKEEIASLTGYSAEGGGFNNSISQLCTLGLAERIGENKIQLNQELLQV